MADAVEVGVTVPRSEFIEDVGKYVGSRAPDVVIAELQNRHRELRLLESQLAQKKARLMGKLPEITKALEIVDTLIEKRGTGESSVVDFELSEQVYAKAKLADVTAVNLWLGAGVMVEYPLQEARDLLAQNLANCKANMETNAKDLEYIRDNATILEVSIARVFNFDVERRRSQQQAT